ncbi:hypothetical protein BT67DRAFT_456288 [Trichocladium antarcticum]|uniref:Uncharacterized protein n=1 Tax=Trichocladium antarcticum TaxID=1450529 RepID=A0AAN6UMB9_9PEZI|nr:hypothetical protein BT67DRAFT_456288 [Trichocladium antarcticum]
MTLAGQMLPRRLQLPQSLARPSQCHRLTTVRFATSDATKGSSSSSSSSPSSTPSRGLFNQLFARRPAHNVMNTRASRRPNRSTAPEYPVPEPSSRNPRRLPLPLGDELRAWLENAVSEVRQAGNDEDGPTVLVLSNASRSLVESDFYRLAPQGRHVDGWAGGITKIVQSVSPVTKEPQGQYFLFFDTPGAAKLYADELKRLHYLARRALGESPPWPDATPPKPNARFDASTIEPSIDPALHTHLSRRATPPPTGADMSHRVLLHLTGSTLPLGLLQRAIAADGAARNLPWRLLAVEQPKPGSPGARLLPRPIQTVRAGSGRIGWGEVAQMEAEGGGEELALYGYSRFVVAFAGAGEARRFARVWHRRELVDERTERVVVVDATALW